MQVTLTIDYAMWILTLLGKTTERINAATMSERLHIPRRYTIKILNRLKESGLVEVRAGVKGGYHLARGWMRSVSEMWLRLWGRASR